MESEKAVAGEDSLMEVTQSTNDGEMTGQTSTSDGNALDSSSAVGNMPSAQDFEFIKPISKGAFGKVWLGCKRNKPDKVYAIKVMKKDDLVRKNLIAQVTAERDAQARSRSPFVVQLFYSIQTQQHILLVMEYMIGGDVKSLLIMYGYFPEEMACMYAAEVTLALEYLHKRGIVHRDLKPDNMLISETGHLKLTDFGLSKVTMDYRHSPRSGGFTPYIGRGGIGCLDLRTPGQVRSLSSSLAFSTYDSHKKFESHACTTMKVEAHPRQLIDVVQTASDDSRHASSSPPRKNGVSPLYEYEPCTPFEKGHKQFLGRRMLTPNTSKCLQLNRLADNLGSTPPIQSLTPTLQDSLTWRTSSASDSRSSVACSLLQFSLLSKSGAKKSVRRETRAGQESCATKAVRQDYESEGSFCGKVSHSHDRECNSCESSSCSVFSSDVEHRCAGSYRCGNSADAGAEHPLSCDSHIMPIFRVEGEEDSTPLLHRKHDSVLKSFSAQNLRSLTEGSYSDVSLNQGNKCFSDGISTCSGQEKNSGAFMREKGFSEIHGSFSPSLSCNEIQHSEPSGNAGYDKYGETRHKFSSQPVETPGDKMKDIVCHRDMHSSKSLVGDEQENVTQFQCSHTGNNISSCSQEKPRGVLSALDDSLGEIHQSRPHSITGSTDLDLSTDFSSHFQKDKNLNSTRLSMDFGPSRISLDFGPELKDLSHLSGLSRLPLYPLMPKLNINHKSSETEAAPALARSLTDSQVTQALPLRKRDDSVKRKTSDRLIAPGSGGEIFRRRLSKPGLRRVLSDTFDKCLLSGSDFAKVGRGMLRKNLLEGKSKSQEIGDHRESFEENELREEKTNISLGPVLQRKRSCDEAMMDICLDMPQPKMQCKLNVPQHTSLTPDLRRLAMRNHVHSNRQEHRAMPSGSLTCNLFKTSPSRRAQSPLASPGFPQCLQDKDIFQKEEKHHLEQIGSQDQISLSYDRSSNSTNQLSFNGDGETYFSKQTPSRFRNGAPESNNTPEMHDQTKIKCDIPVMQNSVDQEAMHQEVTNGFRLHRVPACTDLTFHYDRSMSTSTMDIHSLHPMEDPLAFSTSPHSPKAKHVQFYMDSPSPGPTMHSSPAAGSCGSQCQPPPLIIKKGVSNNESLGHDGSFLNISIEFEVPDGKSITATPHLCKPVTPDKETHSHLSSAQCGQPQTSVLQLSSCATRGRSRSLSSGSTVSDIGSTEDPSRISPGPMPLASVQNFPSPPLTFSKKSPQMSDIDQDLTKANNCSHMMPSCLEAAEFQEINVSSLSGGNRGHRCHGNSNQKSCPALLCQMPSIVEGSSSQEKKAEQENKMDSSVFPRPVSMPLLLQTPKPASRHHGVAGQDPPHVFKTPSCTPAMGAKSVPPSHLPYTPSQARGSLLQMGTPLRTPKSVRRGPEPPAPEVEAERILGTPDYLAPEILLHQQHGFAVDWWALGVCLYEFLTGLPPFNDATPEDVFKNILNRDITWPEGEESLSVEAHAAVDALLTFNVDMRPAALETKKMPFFSDVDWDNLLEIEPLFVPQPDDDMDTTYFKPKNDERNLVMSAVDL